MPYPVAHALFFVFFIGAAGVYALVGPLFRGELSSGDAKRILLLLFAGGFSSLFPDLIVVYNLIVKGTMEHCWIGPFPTHSILFSFSAVLFWGVVGYAVYGKFDRAAYLGLFAWAASLSHLLLDDIDEGGIYYFYPVYDKQVSVFSYMGLGFSEVSLFHYLIASFVSVFFISVIIMMALFALSHFGFEFRYRSEK
ncbi:metal-dependent hydrolase [Methanosarcina sp. KYL-1]|uniref:metal-dependent hydrolase n=1 Tax=Methanosarcina sp. KYL-1 TaxID=2602068 RepID=UPI00210144EA|nr:metal-dependent hydrolase [Methanosarcina sp. KYL-1]MCQ1535875.1 metal-dependent hydrolase [Methanosarcina sp. KYL-1]